jgi:DNA-directed RNA polymerase subunit omega
MVQRRTTLIDPPIEELLDKVDSKFTLVSLSAKRARQINAYYNQLGEGLGVIVPPQVTSVSGKPLTIAFEEIAAAKASYHNPEPGEEPSEVAEGGIGGLEAGLDAAGSGSEPGHAVEAAESVGSGDLGGGEVSATSTDGVEGLADHDTNSELDAGQ